MTTDVINGVPRDQIRAALTKVENALEAAYHNDYPECCGRAGQECCGDTVQAWSEADQKVMDVLFPIRRALSDILAAAQPAADGEREAFKRQHASLDLSEKPDAWGRPQFLHSHVETCWLGWQARAVQPLPAAPTPGASDGKGGAN